MKPPTPPVHQTPEDDCQILISACRDLGKKPWRVVDEISRLIVDYNGNEIALVGNNELAKEIVRAVNNHDDLLIIVKSFRLQFPGPGLENVDAVIARASEVSR